jgi:hypothetical protein
MSKVLYKLATLCMVGVFGLSGCDSGKSFEPKDAFELNIKPTTYQGEIISQSRYGATLEDGHFIDKDGISKIVLPKGFIYLNSTSSKVLCSNSQSLRVIDKKSQKYRDINTSQSVVSATLHNNLIAYILSNNSFGLYSLKSSKKLVEQQTSSSFAINTKAASPIFVDNLAVMPMLDGKLVIVDINDIESANVVYISSSRVFNNVIFLSRIGDTLISATPTKLISLGEAGEFDYSTNLVDIAINGRYIYLFAKDGEIIKFDIKLQKVASKRFDYARYSAVSSFGDKVVAFDKNGALIVLDSSLSKFRIYDIGEVDSPVYISGDKLYKDGEIIDLSKISYK